MKPDRYADLWLTDFSVDPEDVVGMLPVPPFLVASTGKPTGLQGRPAQRNVVIFRHGFTHATSWTDAIEALIRELGGWEGVGQLINHFPGAQRLIQLTLPVRSSPHQENDFIQATTLGRLASQRIDLGMEFGEHRLSDAV
jgi:hypothetical protein